LRQNETANLHFEFKYRAYAHTVQYTCVTNKPITVLKTSQVCLFVLVYAGTDNTSQ